MNFIENYARELSSYSVTVNVLLVIGVTLVASLTSRFVLYVLSKKAKRTSTVWDDSVYRALGAPVRLLIWVVGLSFAVDLVLVSLESSHLDIAETVEESLIIAICAWFLLRLIKNMQQCYLTLKHSQSEGFDQTATEAISKLLKLSVIVVAALVILQTAGFSLAGVLTFGGVGGIAIGFAAKDMLANFFGGLMIYLDRPFGVGDWVRSPDREMEGTVEEIGWRVTMIRNFESRPLYVPNSAFASIAIENVSRMTNRRIYESIGIRYADAKAMDAIVGEVKEYLQNHEDIDQDQTIMVNFTKFAPSSLDFFIYCFTRATTGVEFNRVKQQIMLEIYSIIESNHAECAFPTTTVHIQSDSLKAAAKE